MSARTALANHTASGSTATLATCLLKLDTMPSTPETRTAASAIIEELAARHPEVVTALDAWSMDLDTDLSIAEATIAALPMDAL
jgi:hypothetical protein